MTSLVRRVAGGVTILEALWMFFAYFDASAASCPINGCPGPQFIPTQSILALVLALLVLAVGVLGAWGASVAYFGGAVLSGAALLVTASTVLVVRGYAYLSTASDDAAIGVAFALVALLANVSGIRAVEKLPEQANPMNLPVFG